MSTARTPEHLDVALRIGSAFDRLGIDYMVCGSVASSLHGEPRTTYDLDLVVDLRPEHVPSLLRALEPDFLVDPTAIDYALATGSSCNILHAATALKIDLLLLRSRAFSREEFSRRRSEPAVASDPRTLTVASPEDTVLTKLEWFRKGGEVSERQWRDVVGTMRVAGSELDDEYLDKWAPELGVVDLLARARDEARR